MSPLSSCRTQKHPQILDGHVQNTPVDLSPTLQRDAANSYRHSWAQLAFCCLNQNLSAAH